MSKPIAGPGLLAQIDALIGDDLTEFERIFDAELASTRPCVGDVLSHVRRFRGKRLRPILLLLSAQAAGGITTAHHVLSAVVEMIHTATLVHDDVLDDADTRRHVATVNARWNCETSVLFGDYLFTHAFHLASSLETTHACRLIGRATNRVCEGELMQIHERGNFELTENAYFEIIDGKTAELCALSCRLGAEFASADAHIVAAFEQYGRSLGMAFQIADDLLDLLGREDETGKSLGSDFAKQKLTLPVIRLLATTKESRRIRHLLADPSPVHGRELRDHLESSDAIDYAQSKATEFARNARRQLEGLPASPAQALLEMLPEFAARRSF